MRFKPVRASRLAAGPLAAVLMACAAPGVAADLPALAEPPTGTYQHGKLVWIDLVTADLAGAERFYGGLFGWTFTRLGEGKGAYTMAYQAGTPVAGLVQRAPHPDTKRQGRWLAFTSVADVDAVTRKVKTAGGQMLIAPRKVPGRGEMAVVADPDGAPFGLINSSSGDPPDTAAPVGDFLWAVYQSPDATRAAAFYQDLGGYDVVADDLATIALDGLPSFLLVSGGYARASLVEIPAERSHMRPDWLYFVRVARLPDSLARARELGGSVVLAPNPDVYAGRMAVIADPAGAPLGLMEWDGDEREAN